MNLPRFFCPVSLVAGTSIDLPADAARHACRVLRLGPGDDLTLFDGSGGEYVARILSVSRERVSVELGEWLNLNRDPDMPITLVQALQTGDKMDMTIQKAVELGVSRIVPVSSRRCVLKLEGERARRRVDHWRSVVVSACEQCGRNRLPVVEDIVALDRWLENSSAGIGMRLILAPDTVNGLMTLTPPARDVGVGLLIGPEGGWAPEELASAEAAGFRPLRLGPRVLRTETAGMAAVAAIQALWGDFG